MSCLWKSYEKIEKEIIVYLFIDSIVFSLNSDSSHVSFHKNPPFFIFYFPPLTSVADSSEDSSSEAEFNSNWFRLIVVLFFSWRRLFLNLILAEDENQV